MSVEALLAAPLFCIILSFCFWVWRLHDNALELSRKVREPTWAQAIQGCPSSGLDVLGRLGVDGQVEVVTSPAPGFRGADLDLVPQTVPGGPNQSVLRRPMREANMEQSQDVEGEVIWNFTSRDTKYEFRGVMECNEPVETGQLQAMKVITTTTFVR